MVPITAATVSPSAALAFEAGIAMSREAQAVGAALGAAIVHPWMAFVWVWFAFATVSAFALLRLGVYWPLGGGVGPELYLFLGGVTAIYLPVAYFLRVQIVRWVPLVVAYTLLAAFAVFVVWMLWALWQEIDAAFCLGRC